MGKGPFTWIGHVRGNIKFLIVDLKSKLYSSSISFSDLIASGIEDFEDKLFDFICDSKKRVSIDKFKAVSMINP